MERLRGGRGEKRRKKCERSESIELRNGGGGRNT